MALLKALSKFEEVFQSLNDRQKEAVQHIEGPVLVIAGPGTGKTQILVARIARILSEVDVFPENILCLTYTEAGTVAMRKRLLEFIGPDAYRVNVSTFHGFCNQIIQENLESFGFRNLDPVSKLEGVLFLRELIDGLPKNHLLKRYSGDVYYESGRLEKLFDLMKREDWTPEFLHAKIDSYLDDLPNRDEYHYKRKGSTKDGKSYAAGDIKQDALESEIGKMNLLRAGIDLFEPYQELLRKNNRYDFTDMILWVIRAFRESGSLLSDYQERYQYFLVDEFQDTSGSQNELLQLLLGYWEAPNIFAVGDEDQSIYRFQGANLENITTFIQRFEKHLKVISLQDNYRSTQAILNLADRLIAQNVQRLRTEKKLLAKHPVRLVDQVLPEIHAYYNSIHECAAITHRIQELAQAGMNLNEVAILYRNHQQAEEIMAYFKQVNIGVNARRRVDILQEPLIRKVVLLLEFLRAETKISFSGDPWLFEILHFSEFGIPPLEIARIAATIRNSSFGDSPTGWRHELKKLSVAKTGDLFTSPEANDPLQRAATILENLIAGSFNQTPQETIHQILRETGILSHALTGPDKSWNMELLRTFTDFIKEECLRRPRNTLSDLCNLLVMMVDNKIQIPAERILTHETGVNFITAHSAKGLEFDTVFMIGCNRKPWDESGKNKTFKLPDTIFSVNSTEQNEDSRRLFYVAMTRARSELHISYSRFDLQEKELEASRYLAEISVANAIQERIETPGQEILGQYLHPKNQEGIPVQIPKNLLDEGTMDRLLEKYSLSVTHMNTYLRCPVSFYFNNLIRVPAPRSSSMTFGSAVHFALEQLFKKMNGNEEKQFPDQDTFLKDFRWYMRRHQDSFTDAEFSRRMEYGEEFLPRYYQEYYTQWNKITSIERSYKNVVVEGVPINGKLDKLEFDGNLVNVVDYKTGKFRNAKVKFKRPDPNACREAESEGKTPSFEDKFGGDYWRQAVFYKIIMDHDLTRKWEMRSSEFDFVEPEVIALPNGKSQYQFHKEKVTITPEDSQFVIHQIHEVYKSILNRDFTDGCGKEDCVWCTFTRNYYQNRLSIPAEFTEEDSIEM